MKKLLIIAMMVILFTSCTEEEVVPCNCGVIIKESRNLIHAELKDVHVRMDCTGEIHSVIVYDPTTISIIGRIWCDNR